MKTTENTILKIAEKKFYLVPKLDIVKLDNEISLVLNSYMSLPGDPNPYCADDAPDQFTGSPWE